MALCMYFHKNLYYDPKTPYHSAPIYTKPEYDKALKEIGSVGYKEIGSVGYNFFDNNLILFSSTHKLNREILFDDPFFLPNLISRYKEHVGVGNVIDDKNIKDMIIQEIENELIAQCPIIGQGG